MRWREPYRSDPETINSVLDKIPKNADLQTKVVLTMITLGRNGAEVLQKDIVEKTGAQPAVIQTLAKKVTYSILQLVLHFSLLRYVPLLYSNMTDLLFSDVVVSDLFQMKKSKVLTLLHK